MRLKPSNANCSLNSHPVFLLSFGGGLWVHLSHDTYGCRVGVEKCAEWFLIHYLVLEQWLFIIMSPWDLFCRGSTFNEKSTFFLLLCFCYNDVQVGTIVELKELLLIWHAEELLVSEIRYDPRKKTDCHFWLSELNNELTRKFERHFGNWKSLSSSFYFGNTLNKRYLWRVYIRREP